MSDEERDSNDLTTEPPEAELRGRSDLTPRCRDFGEHGVVELTRPDRLLRDGAMVLKRRRTPEEPNPAVVDRLQKLTEMDARLCGRTPHRTTSLPGPWALPSPVPFSMAWQWHPDASRSPRCPDDDGDRVDRTANSSWLRGELPRLPAGALLSQLPALDLVACRLAPPINPRTASPPLVAPAAAYIAKACSPPHAAWLAGPATWQRCASPPVWQRGRVRSKVGLGSWGA